MTEEENEAARASYFSILHHIKECRDQMSDEDFKAFINDFFTDPYVIANSSILAEIFKDDAATNEPEVFTDIGRFVARMFKESELEAKFRYEAKYRRPEWMELAEMLRRCRYIDPANCSDTEADMLLRYDAKVKAATQSGDRDSLLALAEARKIAHDSEVPPRSREALYGAILVVRGYRLAGLTPTKNDIRDEVERDWVNLGRWELTERQKQDVWKRVWKHPEFAGLEQRYNGQPPIPYPEEWRW